MFLDVAVYREIVKQLKRDGFIHIADELTHSAFIPSPVTFTDGINISKCLKQAISEEEELEKNNDNMLESPIQLDLATQSPTSFNPHFIVDHQGPSSAVAFSQNGVFAAAGSVDKCFKLLYVPKLSKTQIYSEALSSANFKPVIKTFADHQGAIRSLAFHPFTPILTSASVDATIKFMDISKTDTYRYALGQITIPDSTPVRIISYHPSGDYLLVGCDDPIVRIYDVATSVALCCPGVQEHHTKNITHVTYSSDSHTYATACQNGEMRLWDTTTNRVITCIIPHHGRELTSLQSSKSGHYILTTSRKDKYSQLWDLRFMKTLHPVVSYSFRVSSLPPSSSASSLSSSPPTQAPSSVCFSWDESFVYGITPGKSTPSSIRGWNTRTGEQVIYFESSHQSHVSLILSSPTENAVATGGDDNKLKMWFSA